MRSTIIKIYEYLRRRLLFLKRRLVSPILPHNPDGKVYLNLGCGLNSSGEFINVDVLPFPNIHHIQDITDLGNFPDKSVDLIYASHAVEHIPQNKLRRVLLEWKRVLKSGGVLRVSVPDFDNLIEVYEASGRDVSLIRDQVLGQEPPFDNHYTLWNDEQARRLFSELGFVNIRKWDPTTANHHNFTDRSSRLLPVENGEVPLSLNLEMTKP